VCGNVSQPLNEEGKIMVLENDVTHIFTDGACSGNPGPGGAGIVLYSNGIENRISAALGRTTNNIAELTAIEIGLMHVDPKRTIKVYTDSNYCIGVLTAGWKAKANVELINKIKSLLLKFKNITFIKIKGHSGNIYNEAADYLAVEACNRTI